MARKRKGKIGAVLLKCEVIALCSVRFVCSRRTVLRQCSGKKKQRDRNLEPREIGDS